MGFVHRGPTGTIVNHTQTVSMTIPSDVSTCLFTLSGFLRSEGRGVMCWIPSRRPLAGAQPAVA